MAVLLGGLAWLDLRRGGIFLVPPFAATMTIPLYLSDVSIAQPFAIVFGSTLGAAIGTVLGWFLGFGPGIAVLAALTALIALPCCEPIIRQAWLWQCILPCCILVCGLPFRLCCHSRWSR